MDTYSFLDTVLLVNGSEISNYDEGDDVIILERLSDSASHRISADGIMTVALSADRSGVVRFRLKQTSTSNQIMTRLINAQENGAFIPVFVQFKDTRGGDLGSGTQGYIPRPASMTRGVGVNAQEWEIIVERLDLLHQGG